HVRGAPVCVNKRSRGFDEGKSSGLCNLTRTPLLPGLTLRERSPVGRGGSRHQVEGNIGVQNGNIGIPIDGGYVVLPQRCNLLPQAVEGEHVTSGVARLA